MEGLRFKEKVAGEWQALDVLFPFGKAWGQGFHLRTTGKLRGRVRIPGRPWTPMGNPGTPVRAIFRFQRNNDPCVLWAGRGPKTEGNAWKVSFRT